MKAQHPAKNGPESSKIFKFLDPQNIRLGFGFVYAVDPKLFVKNCKCPQWWFSWRYIWNQRIDQSLDIPLKVHRLSYTMEEVACLHL